MTLIERAISDGLAYLDSAARDHGKPETREESVRVLAAWVERALADTDWGAVRLSDEEWARVIWWLERPVPRGATWDLDNAILRKINAQRGRSE
jgi:hypothetical protein